MPQQDKHISSKLRDYISKTKDDPELTKENKILLDYMQVIRSKKYIHSEFINQILQIQKICQYTNTPLVMTFGVDKGFDKKYMQEINQSYWLNDMDFNLTDYCKSIDVPFGPGLHFLEDGHRAVANLFLERFFD
jgi:hypothetical protein